MLAMYVIGMFVGAATVVGMQLVTGHTEPLQIPWHPLPDRIKTLAAWGWQRPTMNPTRATPIAADDVEVIGTLPRRTPAASLSDVPPADVRLHTCSYAYLLARSKLRKFIPARVYVWWERVKNHYLLKESDEAFNAWWQDAWYSASPTANAGRHRRRR
jgi:hypothetical protein